MSRPLPFLQSFEDRKVAQRFVSAMSRAARPRRFDNAARSMGDNAHPEVLIVRFWP
jgi:hypothetical protein